jgi:hypothetical protein
VPFRRYLLPSMLNIKFFAMTAMRTITQFGVTPRRWRCSTPTNWQLAA